MCENNRNDDIDKIFCDNFEELARELENRVRKKNGCL